jgi:hypothetical protein
MKSQAVSHPRGLTSCLTSVLATSLALANPLAPAQAPPPAAHAPSQPRSQPHPSARPAKATPTPLPPFSGTWALDLAHSTIQSQRPPGSSQVVIQYDGRTWRYRHIHSNNYGQVSDDWDTTLTVGAKTLHVAREEPLTFRSRIYLDKTTHPTATLVLEEFVRTDRGGHAHNTVRYSLEDAGATLIETEKSSGPMGTETNRWVLHRQPPGTAPPPIDRKDKDD